MSERIASGNEGQRVLKACRTLQVISAARSVSRQEPPHPTSNESKPSRASAVMLVMHQIMQWNACQDSVDMQSHRRCHFRACKLFGSRGALCIESYMMLSSCLYLIGKTRLDRSLGGPWALHESRSKEFVQVTVCPFIRRAGIRDMRRQITEETTMQAECQARDQRRDEGLQTSSGGRSSCDENEDLLL